MTIDRWLSRIPIDSPSAFMKQVPTILGFGIAAIIAVVPNGVPITNGPIFVAGIALVTVASILLVRRPVAASRTRSGRSSCRRCPCSRWACCGWGPDPAASSVRAC